MDSLKLIQEVNRVAHPAIKALYISKFVAAGLKSGEISLYEACRKNYS